MRRLITLTTALAASAFTLTAVGRSAPRVPAQPPPVTSPDPGPVNTGATVEKGLAWLAEHQLKNGGFGQGEESAQMGHGADLANVANVADTCIATLAFLRSGSTPTGGKYQQNINNALQFVLKEVEASDEESIFVTQVRGTRVQAKLGQAIDTFMALSLLTEVQGKMPEADAEARVKVAVEKILRKMQRNQNADGSFERSGWAPALAQAVGTKALNKASEKGANVDEKLRSRAEDYAKGQFQGGSFKGEGSAGVGLYSAAATVGALDSSDQANEAKRKPLEDRAKTAPTAREREEAQATLRRYDDAKKSGDEARRQMAAQLQDDRFVAGFGNNGGEEFLSYMLVSETLSRKGGAEWKQWQKKMETNLAHVQNGDGSWTGHHCITGRTFVTSAALLVLLTNENTKPVQELMTGRRAS
ncbi:MAG: hypothetical protein AB2A00_09510 [Myxococcota bacterium]